MKHAEKSFDPQSDPTGATKEQKKGADRWRMGWWADLSSSVHAIRDAGKGEFALFLSPGANFKFGIRKQG